MTPRYSIHLDANLDSPLVRRGVTVGEHELFNDARLHVTKVWENGNISLCFSSTPTPSTQAWEMSKSDVGELIFVLEQLYEVM